MLILLMLKNPAYIQSFRKVINKIEVSNSPRHTGFVK